MLNVIKLSLMKKISILKKYRGLFFCNNSKKVLTYTPKCAAAFAIDLFFKQ